MAFQATVTVPVAVPEGGGGGGVVVLPVGEGGGGGGVVPLARTESATGMRKVCEPFGPLSTIYTTPEYDPTFMLEVFTDTVMGSISVVMVWVLP